jgi:tetratricopeptide (TPR) repeat protein
MAIHTGPLPLDRDYETDFLGLNNSQAEIQLQIEYIYHPEDEKDFSHLYIYLKSLENNPYIKHWRKLSGGEDYINRIKSADIIFIIQSDKFAEDYDDWYISSYKDVIASYAKENKPVWPIIVHYYSIESSDLVAEHGLFFSVEKDGRSTNGLDDLYTRINRRIHVEILYLLAKKYIEKGDELRRQHKLHQAISEYDKSLHYVSHYLPALYGKGLAYKELKDFSKAALFFEQMKLATSSPNFTEAYTWSEDQKRIIDLSEEIYKGLAYVQSQSKDFDKAQENFKKVYQVRDSSRNSAIQILRAQALACSGDAYMEQGNNAKQPKLYLTAYEQFTFACQLCPDEVAYLLKKGNACLHLGELYPDKGWYKAACDIYVDASKLFPSDAQMHAMLGDIYRRLGDSDSAVLEYDRAIHYKHPEKASIFARKGQVFLAGHKYVEALDAFNEAIFLQENNSRYHIGKGRSLVELYSYQKAFEAFKRAGMYSPLSIEDQLYMVGILVNLAEEAYILDQIESSNAYIAEASRIYTQFRSGQKRSVDIDYNTGRVCLIEG